MVLGFCEKESSLKLEKHAFSYTLRMSATSFNLIKVLALCIDTIKTLDFQMAFVILIGLFMIMLSMDMFI